MYILTVNFRPDFVEVFYDIDYQILTLKVLNYFSDENTSLLIQNECFRKLAKFLLNTEVKKHYYAKLQLDSCHVQILES